MLVFIANWKYKKKKKQIGNLSNSIINKQFLTFILIFRTRYTILDILSFLPTPKLSIHVKSKIPKKRDIQMNILREILERNKISRARILCVYAS